MTHKDITLLAEAREAVRTGSGREVRERAGLTQGELAQAIKISRPALSRWEAATRRPRGDAAIRYARVLRLLRDRVTA